MVNFAVAMLAFLPLVLAGRMQLDQGFGLQPKPKPRKHLPQMLDALLDEDELEDEFECVDGEGEAYKTYKETADNSFEACGQLCLNDDNCVGFDWNEDSNSGHPSLELRWVNDACRLFGSNLPRIGKTMWGRQYCQKVGYEQGIQVLPETETTTKQPQTRNEAAVQRAKKARKKQIKENAREDAAWKYTSELGAQVEDIQKTRNTAALDRARHSQGSIESAEDSPQSDSLLAVGAPLIVDDPPDEASALLYSSFDCQIGMGEAWKTYRETDANSFEACGNLCMEDDECESFDWVKYKNSGHPQPHWNLLKLWVKDACRLYHANKPRLGAEVANSDRQYCKKVVKDLGKKFSCTEKSQGGAFQAYNETAEGSFEKCGTHCDKDSKCVAFDYSTDAKNGHVELHTGKMWKKDACRLYSGDSSRKDEGLAHRTYCKKMNAEAPEVLEASEAEVAE